MSINTALRDIFSVEKAIVEGQRELNDAEVRALVDFYYQQQESRKRAANQVRALEADGEPHGVIGAVLKHAAGVEELIRARLEPYVKSTAPGRWMLSQVGVGPVLSANMLAHIDIERAKTAGAIWRYAGLDPSLRWEKGQKRPFNARLKVAAWKLGDSFVKVSGNERAFYGKLYRQRKEYEVARNDRGELADQAAEKLQRFNIGKSTDAYKAYSEGKLPPAHLDMRARRWAVKLFLAHLHHVLWEDRYGEPPVKPYVMEHLGHVHCVGPPGWDSQSK